MSFSHVLFAIVSSVALLGCSAPLPDGTTPKQSNADTGKGDDVGAASFEGIAGAKTGMRLSHAVRTLGGSVDTSQGPISDANCYYASLSALPKGTKVMVFGDTIVRFDVDSAGVRTAAGVGVGSSEAEVRRAYGDAMVRQDPHPYSGPVWHYLIVDQRTDTLHRIIFETDGQTVQSYRVGWRRAVDLIEGCS